MQQLDLPNGFYELPTGKLANVVTCLEMEASPQVEAKALPAGYSLNRVNSDDLTSYRALFRKVGEDFLWFSRLIMPDEKLKAILGHKDIESYALYRGDTAVGVMELDFKDMPNCELAFFGLAKETIGSGLGRILMNIAVNRAWDKFKPYALMVEVHDDPRLQGKLPKTASPHVALIDPYC
jgi:hypothetical protein